MGYKNFGNGIVLIILLMTQVIIEYDVLSNSSSLIPTEIFQLDDVN